jgi:hypothetical protein
LYCFSQSQNTNDVLVGQLNLLAMSAVFQPNLHRCHVTRHNEQRW